jgi:outer membrane receptor protein involved in Fe transport
MSPQTMRGLLMGSAVFFLAATPALAQQAPAADPQQSDADALTMEDIVVTASPRAETKFESSVSVSSVSAEALAQSSPRSVADVFRTIPGIRAEGTGGEGNANIAVRGLPVASGGAKFLQLHEDGLPVLEFGDIAFGNADIFLRSDFTVARVEAIRGGSASTFASNSPGGVINLISKTGTEDGGAIAITRGLGWGHTRLDANYGGAITDNLRFHLGGFWRQGEGPREAGYRADSGGQIKGNITREFENGFVRLSFKYLNDKTAGYLPMPVRVTGTGSNPNWESLPGFDIKTDTLHSALFQTDVGLDGNNNRRVTDITDGMHPVVKQLGLEFSFDLADDWKIANKFKWAETEGRFVSPFPSEVGSASALAAGTSALVLGGSGTGATLRYANGPNAGAAFNGTAIRIHLFNTELNDLGNVANNLTLSKSFAAGDGTVDFALGYYKARQSIDTDWVWNSYLMELNGGGNAALLNAFGPAGQALSINGLYAYGVPFWGNCCQRSYDINYDIDAPFLSVAFSNDKLNVEAGVRYDRGSASGTYAGTLQVNNLDVNQNGSIDNNERSVSTIDNGRPSPVDYSWNYWSYSVGANYQFTDAVAVFARISRGGRANADRLAFGPNILPNGSIRSEDAAVDIVNQYELGVKWRADNFSVFVTGFHAKTEEQNFEATTQRFFDRTYKANGIELEAAYRYNGFDVRAGATWTDAEISQDVLNPAVEGNTPRRQADLVYQLAASYSADRFSLGANLIGTTKSFAQDDNDLVMPGYTQVNAFGTVNIVEGLSATLAVNNLFNTSGFTESEEGSIPGNNIVRARSINGRTATISLKYEF